jgi:hypothetical protein
VSAWGATRTLNSEGSDLDGVIKAIDYLNHLISFAEQTRSDPLVSTLRTKKYQRGKKDESLEICYLGTGG